uniref:Uncharacterized protein n=1 Tax=Triticum urartu TaxID=4572 RepID=A0A8R7Q5M3_TRIUA
MALDSLFSTFLVDNKLAVYVELLCGIATMVLDESGNNVLCFVLILCCKHKSVTICSLRTTL